MKKKPNFEKASVSLPPEVHEWLKSEAARRTEFYGESWSVSRIIQEAIREYRTRATSVAPRGQAMPDWTLNEDPKQPPDEPSARIVVPSSGTSAGGYLTRRKANSQKSGKAK